MTLFRATIRVFILLFLGVSLYLSYFLLWFFHSMCWWQRDRGRLELLLSESLRLHLKLGAYMCGLRVIVDQDIKGQLPKDKALFLSNHVSYLDVIALGGIHPMGFVAKKELCHYPLLGALSKKMNTIYVQRESMESRIRCIYSLQKSCKHLSYCVFPQGTTLLTPYANSKAWSAGQLFCLKKYELRIFAVGIRYRDHESLAWVNDMSLVPHLWQVLQRPRTQLGIAIEELVIRDLHKHDLRRLSHQIRETINLLGEKAEMLLPEHGEDKSLVWAQSPGQSS